MKPTLQPGARHELQFIVTSDMCPHFDGVPVHPVCATWTLVHYLELAGRRVLEPHLDPHEEGLGIHISIDHHSPAVIGSTVRAAALAVEVSARRLVCEVQAYAGARLLADGRFVQAVLPKEKLARLFEMHRDASGD